MNGLIAAIPVIYPMFAVLIRENLRHRQLCGLGHCRFKFGQQGAGFQQLLEILRHEGLFFAIHDPGRLLSAQGIKMV